MDWKARITINPAQCGGRPCIRGMRIRVKDVLDLLAAGLTREQVVAELPDLDVADVDALQARRWIILVCWQREQPGLDRRAAFAFARLVDHRHVRRRSLLCSVPRIARRYGR